MIPKLSKAPLISELTLLFIDKLKQSGFVGDVTTQYSDRLTLATDNSVYQQLPEAIVFPKSTADIALLTQIGSLNEFEKIIFTPRGGGTGTNGQSLTHGIVVDLSRHMNRILEINTEERWVRVQAGVVKDQLNAFLKPHGFFFSPELSTSNRATIGGMINTDASGQGSLVYGKTSDHVLALRSVLLTGELLDTEKVSIELARQLAKSKTTIGKIYDGVLKASIDNKTLILEKFPPLNRFLTGYDLKNVINDTQTEFDLCRILSGSEGTLAFISEAKLNITPIPKIRRLININYDSFDAALRAAPSMLEAKALSVETIDSKVLNLAKEDIIWQSVSELVSANTQIEILGLNMVEFAGDDVELIESQVLKLSERLDELMQQNIGVLGYRICTSVDEIERVYAMRKKAVGLLGNVKGQAKPVAFVEDTCVPPAVLADYIKEFRALLDRHELTYGMFGHVDAGVLHVRPALDLYNPTQELLLNEITDEVVKLTQKYGGLLWGEHGKGYRAQYSPEFFGMELYNELRKVKALFDPFNRLNPGKICTPITVENADLIRVDAQKRATFDRQIPVQVRNDFIGALECNGNGLCFNYDQNSVMCPSMKVTANRLHSPKGRAAVVREWLRLLALEGFTPEKISESIKESTTVVTKFRTLIEQTKNQLAKRKGEYDFSHEVKASLDGCLSCKACASLCPIKIDVPHFKAQFLHLYHSRYHRPLGDHFLAEVERLTPVMAKIPKIINFMMAQPVTQKISSKLLGMQDLPLLSEPSLQKTLKQHPTANMSVTQLEQLTVEARKKFVLIVQDPFTSYYEAELLVDLVKLIDLMGLKPVVLPFKPNGKPQHVKGALSKFYKTASNTARFLNRVAALDMPMIGVDAALVLCYRDEYNQILGVERGDFNIQLVQEWLLPALDEHTIIQTVLNKQEKQSLTIEHRQWSLLLHCTEGAKAPQSSNMWQNIFAKFSHSLALLNVGCCGMAGTYGHETVNIENSKALYKMSWEKQLQNRNLSRCLATGYSCRSQAKRMANYKLNHPVSALVKIIEGHIHG